MNFGKNCNMIFWKWWGAGGGQRPFGTFLKIHPFWSCQASLNGDNNLDHGQRWWTPMEMACSTTPSLFNSSRTNWDSSENPNRYQNVQQTWQYKYETWKYKQKCGWGKKWIRNVRSPQTWLGGTFGPTSKESCNITLDIKQPICNWNGTVGKG